MPEPPSISVILPVFNGERYIKEAIDSVLAQTGASFELLIGDDASTDKSQTILSAINDPRVKVFLFETNAGLFGNLNRLLSQARGPLVRFLCQDDILNTGCLEEEASFFEAHPEAVMSICQATEFDAAGNITGQWQTGGLPVVYDRSISLQLFLYEGCVAGNLSTVCARRAQLDLLGGFDESFRVSGDYEMWVRLCTNGCLGDLQKPLIRMRQHAERLSLSPGSGVLFVSENRQITHKLLRLFPESLRAYARRYLYLRQNVLDTHELMSSLRRGNLSETRQLLEVMGARDVLAGLVSWLLTLNNHLYRPKPSYVSDQQQ